MAKQQTFYLTISRVDEVLFQGSAISVYVPGTEGDMTVLAHHQPLIATLRGGEVVVLDDTGASARFSVSTGILEVSNNQATILV